MAAMLSLATNLRAMTNHHGPASDNAILLTVEIIKLRKISKLARSLIVIPALPIFLAYFEGNTVM